VELVVTAEPRQQTPGGPTEIGKELGRIEALE